MTDWEKQSWILLRRGICRSRADLAKALHISRPTASVIADALLRAGVIGEAGPGKGGRGKAPILLVPAAERLYTIGLDLGYSAAITGVLTDGGGRIVRQDQEPFDRTDMESTRESMLHLIRRLSCGKTVSGLGAALSGIIDPVQGKVLQSINPVWQGRNLKSLFADWTGLPVQLGNRSRYAAFSEAFGGAADGRSNFILLSLGRSIGAAFWLNGELFSGTGFAAGEIRSMRLGNGLLLEDALLPERCAQTPAAVILKDCADGIRQLTGIMDVHHLILAGRFADFGADFVRQLEQQLAADRPCEVRLSAFGRAGAARGAAMSAAEQQILNGN